MRIPRYGLHNGIKYSPRRTLVRPCEVCNQYIEIIGSSKARTKYCDVCKLNKKLEYKRKYDSKRPKTSKAELMKLCRERGSVKTKPSLGTTNLFGKPPEEPSDVDWEAYANKIKKEKRELLGGYEEDYYDIEE